MNRNLRELAVTVDGKPYRLELPGGELLGKAATKRFNLQ